MRSSYEQASIAPARISRQTNFPHDENTTCQADVKKRPSKPRCSSSLLEPPIHTSDICGTMLGRDRLPPVQMISSQLEDVSDQQFDILHCSVLRNAVFLICCNYWYSSTGQEWDCGLSTLTELLINFNWLFYDNTVIRESDNRM